MTGRSSCIIAVISLLDGQAILLPDGERMAPDVSLLPEHSLLGRTALVTGGSRGIGRAVCLALARHGANVIVNYTSQEAGAREVAQEITAIGREALVCKADVSVSAEVNAMAAASLKRFDAVDILVNNAGTNGDHLLVDMPDEEWDRVVDINLKGPFLCAKAFAPHMMERRWGRIVNVSTVYAIKAPLKHVHYAASKVGLLGLTRAAARELAPYGITVNVVLPNYTRTDAIIWRLPESEQRYIDSTPLGYIAEPEDIANVIVFLATDAARYVTGAEIPVSGGMHIR
jgi:3-oxoacyl-[acyl-carrier protein] reductase